MKKNRYVFWGMVLCILSISVTASGQTREKISLDKSWKFFLEKNTPYDSELGYGKNGFSYFAKTGFADGPAGKEFDTGKWSDIDLPHDWVVEMPFDERASASHGYLAGGKGIKDAQIGWYRKTLNIPQSDQDKRIYISFDGVFRDSVVWVNGHFLGRETSGYAGFSYDLTNYLNFGGENTIAVRVDASLEEGWFYEGAGIYRHVWLNKVNPVHVAENGTFVRSTLLDNSATLSIETTLENQTLEAVKNISIEHLVFDEKGNKVAVKKVQLGEIGDQDSSVNTTDVVVDSPSLWSIEHPTLYKLTTRVFAEGKLVDSYDTHFGIRTIRFDPNLGFFLNGKRVKIQGTNNHQDHAGVGAAIPDDLYFYRIKKLKAMGSNAYRASHNPTSPVLLEATDKLGMLVIAENRLMGDQKYHFDHLKRLILRDRNHPSVIAWSIGNEEWAIEGNDIGKKLTASMQNYVNKLDSSRIVTQAISGGWGQGSSTVIEMMGFNYLSHGDTAAFHKQFPNTPGWGTEEGATFSTRGIYEEDAANAHFISYDKDPSDWGESAEESWSYYGPRDYLAGAFIWTGFDYRGETTPYTWPAVSSQFGLMDTCGFPKDNYYYYKSWWVTSPVVHVFPHWNWPAEKIGKKIPVWVYSNAAEVELFQDGKSLGKKAMTKFSHLEWDVTYTPGKLMAVGYYPNGKTVTDKVETTGPAQKIGLKSDRLAMKSNGTDLAIIDVFVKDNKNRIVPIADNEIEFDIKGPGKIIGVGNGNPSSHEPDKFTANWKRKLFNGYAQVIVQATDESGKIVLIAKSKNLKVAEISVKTSK